jgi:thioredoxin-like negative regulator of GroEL
MYPNEPQKIEEVENLIKSHPAILLYFYSDKCAPCMSLRPKVVELLCNRFPEMKLVFIDSAAHPEIPANYGAFAMPTLILFFDGKEYNRKSKYMAIPELADTISRPYKMLFEI